MDEALALRSFLESFNLFTQEELDEVQQLAKLKTYKKGEYFIRSGEVCKSIAYIYSGSFRSYYMNSDQTEDVTYCIMFDRNFITAYTSFLNQSPTIENIQAITDTRALILPKEIITDLENKSINWLRFMKMSAEAMYIELENRIFHLQKESATYRYQQLIKNRSDEVQKVPLKYIASYLGISQRHLSRIRAEVKL